MRELREALHFEQEQLKRLQDAAPKLQMNPVQAANWPALVASHERAIAAYRARLDEIERGQS